MGNQRCHFWHVAYDFWVAWVTYGGADSMPFVAFFTKTITTVGGGTVVQDPEIANFWFKPCIAIFNIH